MKTIILILFICLSFAKGIEILKNGGVYALANTHKQQIELAMGELK